MTGSQAGGPNFERFIVLGFICMATGLTLLPLTILWRWLYAATLNGQFILWQILSPMADDATKWLFTFYCSSFVLACVLTRYVFDNRQIDDTEIEGGSEQPPHEADGADRRLDRPAQSQGHDG